MIASRYNIGKNAKSKGLYIWKGPQRNKQKYVLSCKRQGPVHSYSITAAVYSDRLDLLQRSITMSELFHLLYTVEY